MPQQRSPNSYTLRRLERRDTCNHIIQISHQLEVVLEYRCRYHATFRKVVGKTQGYLDKQHTAKRTTKRPWLLISRHQ